MYEKQMELFNDGGLKDEGGMIDEVSGNDVPVGSTREEVRDDIPAMLSEGEFVFPADVVRYLGLNRLMQLRQEAKMGLKQMEAMGQMGNSEEAIIPDDLPFDVLEIMVMEEDDDDDEPQEKYQGGVLHAQRGTFVTPMFDPSNQDVRKYVNADGKTLMIPFLNGNPVYPVPAGYLPEGAAAEETPVEEAVQSSDDNDPPPPPPQSEFQKAGGFGMDTSATDGEALATWIKEAEKVGTVGNVVAGIASAINPLIGGAIALANKKQKKDIVAMLDEKIAQAQKTPIAGQVKALRDLKTRLTTTKGKGILSTVVSGIMDTISDALGFGEEEKKKAKVNAVVTAGSDTDESDDATKNKINIVDKNAGGAQDPDALAAALSTADEAAIAGSTLKEDGTYDISSWYSPAPSTDPEKITLENFIPEDAGTNQPVVSDSQLTDVGVDRFKSYDTEETRDALGFSGPTVEPNKPDPEKATFESFTPEDAETLKTNLASVDPVVTAEDALRKSLSNYLRGNLSADATEESIKSYLDSFTDQVDTIAKDKDKSPTAPTTTATTTAPVQGGGDDDDGDPFADLKAQIAATQAQGQVLKDTNAAVASAAAEYEANQAAEEEGATSAAAAGATPGGPGGQYGMKTGGFVSKPSKKKKN